MYKQWKLTHLRQNKWLVIIIRWNEFKRNLLDSLLQSLSQSYYWIIDTLMLNEFFKVNKHNISYNVDTPIKVLYRRETFSSLLKFDWYQSRANVPISQNYKLFLLQLITRFLNTSINLQHSTIYMALTLFPSIPRKLHCIRKSNKYNLFEIYAITT